MKKRLPFVAILLTFICLFAMFTAFNTAKATEIPTTDEIVNTMTDSEVFTDEDRAKIKELIDTVEGYTNDSNSVIVRVVVPIVIAVAVCLLGYLILLIPFSRNRAEVKTLKGMIKTAKGQVEEDKKIIEELKAKIDIDAFKKEIKEYISTDIKNIMSIVHTDLTKEGVELSKIETILLAIVNGAINAWQGSPEAVAKLTCIADAELVKSLTEENAKQKAYIQAKLGNNGIEELEKF